MTIDLDSIVQAAKPWDLGVTIEGKRYGIRRLSSADFKTLTELQNRPAAEGRKFILGLFEKKTAPDVDSLTNDQVSALIGVVVAYYQDAVIRKNFDAAQQAVAKQLSASM